MRYLITLSAVLVGAVPALSAPAARPDPGTEAIRKDARLRAPLTLAEKDRPLGELLPAIGEKAGVSLKARADTADDKVTLFLKDRPASEALAEIARMLDFQWTRAGDGYTLIQNDAARARERKLRDGALAERLRELQAQMARIGQLLQTPRNLVEARRNELQARVQAQGAALGEAERKAIRDELQALASALEPGVGPAVTLYRSLGPAQSQHLLGGGEVKFSTKAGTLPDAVAQQIHRAAGEARISGRVMVLRAGPGGPPADDNAPPTGAAASIRLTGFGEPSFGPGLRQDRAVNLQVMMSSIRGEGQSRRVQPVIWSPAVALAAPASDAGTTATDDPDLKQQVDLLPGSSPAPAPQGPPAGGPAPRLGRRFLVPRGDEVPLSRAAELLHGATGLQVVGDSFIHARVSPSHFRGKRTVAQVLNGVAEQAGYTWEKEGRTISLRNPLYYRDRPEEVPERLVRPWRAQVAKAGGFTLDDLSAIASALTDPRLRGLADYWAWYLEGPGVKVPEAPMGLYQNRYHLRFWASLLPAQRETARKEILPAANMTTQQRLAFAAAFASPGALNAAAFGDDAPSATPAELAAGGFTLKSREGLMQSFSGTGPEGQRVQLRTLGGPLGGAPGAIPMIEGGQFTLEVQDSVLTDFHTFHYHLAGNPTPARTANVQVARPSAPRR